MKNFLIALGTFTLPLSALAHPTGHQEEAWLHFFSHPFHIIPLVGMMGALGYVALKKVYSKK